MLLIVGFIGLCLGSFICVAIDRFSPEKTTWQYLYTISLSRSRCNNCHHRLPFLSLIPLFSWLIQKGKCQFCFSQISLHYVLIECFTALFCIGFMLFFGISIQSVILILLGLVFAVLATIDQRYFLLPNCFTYFILCTGILIAYFRLGSISLYTSLLGMMIGFLLLWIPAKSYYLIKRKTGLGGGDIKLLCALGAWIDYSLLPLLVIIASLMGLLHFMIIFAIKPHTKKKTTMIPFGPYLLISAYGLLVFQYYEYKTQY